MLSMRGTFLIHVFKRPNILRNLASSCQFGAFTEEMIRDRLVIGLQDKSTKARLLRERKDLSLDKDLTCVNRAKSPVSC